MDQRPPPSEPAAERVREDGPGPPAPLADPATRVLDPGEQPTSEAERQLAETVRTVSRLEEQN